MTKIKICGLKREEDIAFVNEYMPDYVGFVFAGEKRRIDDTKAKQLKSLLKPDIPVIGVFVNEDRNHIIKLVQEKIIDIIQLHGEETNEDILELKKATNCQVIKAIRVKTTEDILRATELDADFLLLDTYVEGMHGGSGTEFDKNLIPDKIGRYFLAGGLNTSNLENALKKCNPYAVDLSSGVETEGFKDKEKIKKVIEIVREYNESKLN